MLPGQQQACTRPVGRAPPRRDLVLHLNRLFWRDGGPAIRGFGRKVDRYARSGFESEIQVRYQPPEGRDGDLRAWSRFVRKAVVRLGRRRAVTAFTITNEINFPVSPNTSDGSHDRALEAMVRGMRVADRVLRRLGRPNVDLGFTVAWRYLPQADAEFWTQSAHADS